MISLFVSGVLIAGLMLLEKLGESHDRWGDEKEHQEFKREREKWRTDMMYWNFFR